MLFQVLFAAVFCVVTLCRVLVFPPPPRLFRVCVCVCTFYPVALVRISDTSCLTTLALIFPRYTYHMNAMYLPTSLTLCVVFSH